MSAAQQGFDEAIADAMRDLLDERELVSGRKPPLDVGNLVLAALSKVSKIDICDVIRLRKALAAEQARNGELSRERDAALRDLGKHQAALEVAKMLVETLRGMIRA